MAQRISRRTMLLAAGAVALRARAAPAVPGSFDHLQLGCGDLDQGIDFVERRLGVRAAIGGVHPGRGSRNALLSFGGRQYLEIIAPDPAQSEIVHYPQLRSMTDPRLIGWAAHPPDIAALAKQLQENKVEFTGPSDGSRKRPDGTALNWKTINLADDRHGLLPFFIQWSPDSVHPSKDAPAKCTLDYFEILSADPQELAATLKRIGIDFPVQRSDKTRLQAVISGPKGDLKLIS